MMWKKLIAGTLTVGALMLVGVVSIAAQLQHEATSFIQAERAGRAADDPVAGAQRRLNAGLDRLDAVAPGLVNAEARAMFAETPEGEARARMVGATVQTTAGAPPTVASPPTQITPEPKTTPAHTVH